NQSLLDALECLSRVVVPTARCFSSDSYGGSVTTRSTDASSSSRSHATASPPFVENLAGCVPGELTRVAYRLRSIGQRRDPSGAPPIECARGRRWRSHRQPQRGARGAIWASAGPGSRELG